MKGPASCRRSVLRVRNFEVGDRVIGSLLFEFSDRRLASGWGGFCEFALANDHDAMLADGVADAAHGWVECYEIQRRVDADVPAEEAALLCTCARSMAASAIST